MRKAILAALVTTGTMIGGAFAQDGDCIENVNGKTVCGADADAVRARIRAEQAAARGEDPKSYRRPSRSGSAYSGFKNSIGLRSGYVFDSTGGGDGIYGGLAYTRKINNSVNAIKVDFELYGVVDSYNTESAGAFLTSLIWQYEGGPVQPFISGGIGYLGATDGVNTAGAFAYQGRAGVNFQVIRRLGIEGAYRYLAATNSNGSAALHGAELNFNIDF